MYAITAQIETEKDSWTGSRQVPTFFLDENVQGFMDEAGAVRVATEIIRATGDYNNYVHVTAVKIS